MSTTALQPPQPGRYETPRTASIAPLRGSRSYALAIGACALALVAAGCGGSSSTSSSSGTGSSSTTGHATTSAPATAIKRAADGSFFARVAGKSAAVAACKTQHELGLQLKQLGASGPVELVAFQYGQGTPTAGPNTYALGAGDVASPTSTVTLCGVGL